MTEREPFAALVELGSAVGELGAALSQAQWRMDQATLDLAAEMTAALAPSFRHPADSGPEEAAGRAAAFVRERLTFYAMPRVDVRLESAVRATRSHGGLVRVLLGGSSTTGTQETAGHVEVSLVAVPAAAHVDELVRARAGEQQRALVQYLQERGAAGLVAPEITGAWSTPGWRDTLALFQQRWNAERREEPGETADLLPETGFPDRRTLAVLGELAERARGEEGGEALQAEARLLLAALSTEDDVHRPDRGYPRDAWSEAWSRLHTRAAKELLGRDGAVQPTRETVEALRRAWSDRRRL
jgi:hypothetical protein